MRWDPAAGSAYLGNRRAEGRQLGKAATLLCVMRGLDPRIHLVSQI
jgi:hypothetical protein